MSQPYQPPRDPYLTPPPNQATPSYQPQGYGYPPPGHGPGYPEASQATLAFVFGILGIIVLQALAPFAWWLGGKEKRAIDAGLRDPANRGLAVAGWVLGIIGTVLLALVVLVVIGYVVFFGLALAGALAGSSWYGTG